MGFFCNVELRHCASSPIHRKKFLETVGARCQGLVLSKPFTGRLICLEHQQQQQQQLVD
jgi:hypothetical protein